MTFEAPKITKTMAKISEAMADGYKFTKIRFALEDLQDRADKGDEAAKKLVELVYQFDRLLKVIGE